MDDWKAEVEKVLDEVRPSLVRHGGDAILDSIEGKVVRLKLKGACDGCSMSTITFGMIVTDMIKERIPEIKQVIYE